MARRPLVAVVAGCGRIRGTRSLTRLTKLHNRVRQTHQVRRRPFLETKSHYVSRSLSLSYYRRRHIDPLNRDC